MANFAEPNKDLVVITTESKWDEMPRMRHYIAKQLSRVFNVLYIEIHSKGFACTKKISDTLIVHRIGGYIRGVHRLRITKAINDILQTHLVLSFIKKCNAPNIILLNFRYDFWRIYGKRIFSMKYFFLNDDFVNMNPEDKRPVRDIKQKLINKVVSLSDRVFTSSDPLADDVRKHANAVTVIYSGHDFVEEINRERNNNGKINVCFMGFIQGNLETSWIEELAKEKNIRIVFVGPVHHQGTFERLCNYNNIEFLPPLQGKDLQGFMSVHDVFIMPYTSELVNTKATVPAKMFQYLACGRPIISSLLPNLIPLPDKFVYQATSAKDFVRLVFKAYEEDHSDLYLQRVEYARNHHWNARGQKLLDIIRKDLESSLTASKC